MRKAVQQLKKLLKSSYKRISTAKDELNASVKIMENSDGISDYYNPDLHQRLEALGAIINGVDLELNLLIDEFYGNKYEGEIK